MAETESNTHLKYSSRPTSTRVFHEYSTWVKLISDQSVVCFQDTLGWSAFPPWRIIKQVRENSIDVLRGTGARVLTYRSRDFILSPDSYKAALTSFTHFPATPQTWNLLPHSCSPGKFSPTFELCTEVPNSKLSPSTCPFYWRFSSRLTATFKKGLKRINFIQFFCAAVALRRA